MTEVELYGDVYGIIKFDGSQESRAVKFSVNIKHNIISSRRAGRKMPYKISDGCEVTGGIGRDQVDPAWLAAMLTDIPTTGTAEELKTGIAVSADGWTDFTDTEIATPSRIKFTVATAAITTAGYQTIVGEDAAGNIISEDVYIDTLDVSEYVVGSTLFKRPYGCLNKGVRSTGEGTLSAASIAGDTSATLSTDQKTFSLSGEYAKGGNYVRITCNHCLFDSGNFNIQEGSPGRDDMTWYMRGDDDSDLIVEGVNA